MNGWLIALAIVALIVLIIIISMIPEMRRYLRMRRM
ncbi:MAG: hypothetical protein QOG67_539 [Verrucomicrobiota bacterium]|jgi:membrane protein YdbS with pleckstrin-like domain